MKIKHPAQNSLRRMLREFQKCGTAGYRNSTERPRICDKHDFKTEQAFQKKHLHNPSHTFLSRYINTYVFFMEKHSLSHINKRFEEVITGLTIESLEKVWKNMNNTIYHIIRVNYGHVEQYHI